MVTAQDIITSRKEVNVKLSIFGVFNETCNRWSYIDLKYVTTSDSFDIKNDLMIKGTPSFNPSKERYKPISSVPLVATVLGVSIPLRNATNMVLLESMSMGTPGFNPSKERYKHKTHT